jgi:SAM-dependent methyltransferase
MALTATTYDRRYYEEHKAADLDYLVYGDWQQRYGRWLVDALELRDRVVLDVGCACGSIANGIREAGALYVAGVDLSEHMIGLGREQFPGVALHTCDAVNLHVFGAGMFDCVHSAQSAEHWRPELVRAILGELRRETRPGGWLVMALDTPELYERQGRSILNEDPTHVCVRSLDWWEERLQGADWVRQLPTRLTARPDYVEHFKANDWDLLLARAV